MNDYDIIREFISQYIDITEITPLVRGYSGEKKYVCISRIGKKYLVRVNLSDNKTSNALGNEQFKLIKALRQYSSMVPDVHYFLSSDIHHISILILDYIDGEDGEEALKTLDPSDQYEIGRQAGEELKKIHNLTAPQDHPAWSLLKWRKFEWYLNEYIRSSQKHPNLDIDNIEFFIRRHRNLMDNIISTFQHDDYHPANLIMRNNKLNGIIDFNRCDYGDPIHDFYKVAFFSRNISVPFSCGQVDGYFKGVIPPDFWMKYSFYVAMSTISDLVWSERYGKRTGSDNEFQKSVRRVSTILDDHDGFNRYIPRWFERRSE